MNDRNENRPGYKKTKVGWIPYEWEVVRLKDICYQPVSGYSLRGADRPAKQGEHEVLRLSCIQNGRFEPSDNKLVEAQEVTKLKTPVRKDTLLVSRSNTDELVGAVCFVDRDIPNIFLSDLIWEVSAFNKSDIYIRWLFYLLCSDYYRAQILARANGTSGSMKRLRSRAFLALIFHYRLRLNKKNRQNPFHLGRCYREDPNLIEAKKRRKKALMQQLLTGRKRLPGFGASALEEDQVPQGWQEMKLNQAFKRVKRTTTPDVSDVLSITAKVGFVQQKDKFSRIIAGRNFRKYILLYKGEFAYNKGNTKTYPQGCVYMLEDFDEAAVPNVYFCFRSRTKDICGNFYKFYFENGLLNHQLKKVINTGVRNDGLLNLNPTDFFNIKIKVPPIPEQHCLTDFLISTTSEITHLEKKLKALEKQKRGLMQKLLTGEIRVKVNDKVGQVEEDS